MYLYSRGEYTYDYDESRNSARLIEDSKRRVDKKKREFQDVEYEYHLLQRDRFRILKENITYDYMGTWCIPNVFTWLKCLKTNTYIDDTKLDGRKKYDEKGHFEYFKEELEKYLGVESIEIIDGTWFGFEKVGANIEFMYKDFHFVIHIPIVKNVSYKYFETYDDYYFKISLSCYTSKSCSSTFFTTFNEEELKGKIDEYINKKAGVLDC